MTLKIKGLDLKICAMYAPNACANRKLLWEEMNTTNDNMVLIGDSNMVEA